MHLVILKNREKYLEIEMGWDAESSSLRSCTEQVSVFAKLLMKEFLNDYENFKSERLVR